MEDQEKRDVNSAAGAATELTELLGGIGRTIQESIRTALQGRGNVLMVRVNDESLRAVDSLVEAGLFKTRSEAAAFLLHEGIQSKREVFDGITETVGRITQMREDLRSKLRGHERIEVRDDTSGTL